MRSERATPRNAKSGSQHRGRPPARTRQLVGYGRSGGHRPKLRQHANLLERQERPRDAEARSGEPDERGADDRALHERPARRFLDAPERVTPASRPAPSPRRSDRRSRRRGSLRRRGIRRRTASGRTASSSRPAARAGRPRPECHGRPQRVRAARPLAWGRRRRCGRAPRRGRRCSAPPTTIAPDAAPAESSFASCSASMPLTPIGPTDAGSASRAQRRADTCGPPSTSARMPATLTAIPIARAHRGRECSGARRSARGSRPSRNRRR